MQPYTPPMGTGSTQDYDRAIRLWTRERRWRSAMLEALGIARGKAAAAHLDIEWRQGFAGDLANQTADAVVSSLVLHQMPLTGKATTLRAMHRSLRPGGRLLIADYGWQRGLMRLLFRLTVQRLDGVSDTQPNADGVVPRLILAAGFEDVAEPFAVPTVTGTIRLITARRPRSA